MGINDGQAVAAGPSNAAWLAANKDDVAQGKIGLNDAASATITDIQNLANRIKDAAGVDEGSNDGTTYGAPADTIDDGDNHELALTKLANFFDGSSGHIHDGTDGNGPPIQDTRMPTQDENDALVGTTGAPSTSNPYVTKENLDNQVGTEPVNPAKQAIAQGAAAADLTGYTWDKDNVQTATGQYTIRRRVVASEGRRSIVDFYAFFDPEAFSVDPNTGWSVDFVQRAGTINKSGITFTFTDTAGVLQIRAASDTVPGGGAYDGFITGKTNFTFVTE